MLRIDLEVGDVSGAGRRVGGMRFPHFERYDFLELTAWSPPGETT